MKEQIFKVQVYTPQEEVDKVREAIGRAGAGAIGNYDYCAFVTLGKGYFRPLEGASPAIGERGKVVSVAEAKIEFLCPKSLLPKVLKAIEAVHPYEEIAIDLLPWEDWKQYREKHP